MHQPMMKVLRRTAGGLAGMALVLAVGCGGGEAGKKAATTGGKTIKTAGGQSVSVIAHNHWKDGKKKFEQYEKKGWNDARCDEVVGLFEEAVSAQSDFAEALYMAGLTEDRCDRHEQAMEFYRKALRESDKYCKARVAVGLDKMRNGDNLAAAKQEFVRAVQNDPQCTEGYVNLAITQRRQGGAANNGEALNNLRRALAINAQYLPAFNEMALLYLDEAEGNKKKLDLAEVVCSQAQKIDKQYPPVYNTWGLIDLRRKDIISAAAKFKKAIELDPDMFEAYMNFGNITLGFRGYQDAKNAFVKAVELQPDSYEAHLGLGVAYRGLEQNEKAQSEYEKAIELDAKRPQAYYNLGVLYQDFMGGTMEDMNQAKKYYDQFLSRARGERKFASTIEEITRRCAAKKGRRRRNKDCTNGRLQNIEETVNALKAMEEMQKLQEQQQQKAQEQKAQEQAASESAAPEQGAAGPEAAGGQGAQGEGGAAEPDGEAESGSPEGKGAAGDAKGQKK